MSHWNIAAAQYHAEHACVDKHIAAHLRFIDAAARQQCQLLVFPELSLTGLQPADAPLPAPPDEQKLKPLLDAAHRYRLTIIAGTPVQERGWRTRGLACFTPDSKQIRFCAQERGACMIKEDSSLELVETNSDSPDIDDSATLLTHSLAAGEQTWHVAGSRLQRFAHKYAIAVLMANRNNSALWDARGQLIVRADRGQLLLTGHFVGQGWQGDIIPLG